MSIRNSHLWRKLKRGTLKEQICVFCEKTIPKGTKNVWKYDSPYRTEYACPKCK